MSKKTVGIIIGIFALSLLSAGLSSELGLGDEVHNFRFAKLIYLTGHRVTQDPLYSLDKFPVYSFAVAPLWHFILVAIWKLTGGISAAAAQIYHSFYYLLLVFLTYLLGKEFYGEKEGLYSALIVASVPMVVSFSILFYLDVPVTGIALLSCLLLKKRKFFLAGVSTGLMFLTKITGLFLVPGFVFLAYYFSSGNRFLIKIKNAVNFSFAAGAIILCDIIWRYNNIHAAVVGGGGNIHKTFSNRLLNRNWQVTEFLNSYLTNPVDIVKYLGLVFLTMFVLYFIYRKFKKIDLPIWIVVISYMLCYAYIFGFGSDIRYIMPVVPFLVILISKIAASIKHRNLKIALVVVCFIQTISVCVFVCLQRRISPGVKEGFAYIRENTPKDALIMYPEENFLNGTERRMIWSAGIDYRTLFWVDNNSERVRLFKEYGIDYIMVKKSRIYDDSRIRHFGGYPRSFVEKLDKDNLASLIFSNDQVDIWKIN